MGKLNDLKINPNPKPDNHPTFTITYIQLHSLIS